VRPRLGRVSASLRVASTEAPVQRQHERRPLAIFRRRLLRNDRVYCTLSSISLMNVRLFGSPGLATRIENVSVRSGGVVAALLKNVHSDFDLLLPSNSIMCRSFARSAVR